MWTANGKYSCKSIIEKPSDIINKLISHNYSYNEIMNYIISVKNRILNNSNALLEELLKHKYKTIKTAPIHSLSSYTYLTSIEKFNINGDNNDYKKSYIYKSIILPETSYFVQYKLHLNHPFFINNYNLIPRLILNGAKIDYHSDSFENSLLYFLMTNIIKNEKMNVNHIIVLTCLLMNNISLIYNSYKQTPYQYAMSKEYPWYICEFIYNKTNKIKHKTGYINPVIKDYISILGMYVKETHKYILIKGLTKEESIYIINYNLNKSTFDYKIATKIMHKIQNYHFNQNKSNYYNDIYNKNYTNKLYIDKNYIILPSLLHGGVLLEYDDTFIN